MDKCAIGEPKRGQERDSSIELFRILVTFMVLVVHFTGWFVGGVSDFSDATKPIDFRIGQTIIESLCIVCVNGFLILSGWFGIKLKLKSIWKLWTIIVFIYVPFYIVDCLLCGSVFSILVLCDSLLAFTKPNYFIQCYVMLMLLSPFINTFFEKYQKKATLLVLTIWVIEVFMENIRGNTILGIDSGYSVIHFIIMYMLARTASLYKDAIVNIPRKVWIGGYFLCAVFLCLCHITGFTHTWDYSNPIVVIESFCLFFVFLYKPFYNKSINWLASSTLSVFIIHTTSPVYDLLVKTNFWLLGNLSYPVYVVSYFAICVIVFFASITYDKCRTLITHHLTDNVYERISRLLKPVFVKYS